MAEFPFPGCPFVSYFTEETGPRLPKIGAGVRKAVDANLLIFHETARIRYEVNGRTLLAEPGSVVFLPEQADCAYEVLHGGSVICIGYQSLAAGSPREAMLLTTYAPKQLKDRFLHFASATSAPTLGGEIAMLADFYGILYDLNRNTAEGNRRTLQADRIRPSVAYLEKHFAGRGLNMKQIAALSGMSDTHFRTLFERLYGCTPLRFVTRLRLEQAALLLKETDLALQEIADRCGFGDVAHFTRCFKQHRGISPAKYRQA